MSFDSFLATADVSVREILGSDVTYTPTVGVAVTVRGVFDAAFVKVDLGQPGVASVGPAVFLRLSDLPSNPETDTTATVTINSVSYYAHEVQPDGLGGLRLLLNKV